MKLTSVDFLVQSHRFRIVNSSCRCAIPTIILFLALFLAATARPANAQQKQLYVRGKLQHINGINLAWMNTDSDYGYGHDVGPNHYTGDPTTYIGDNVGKYYADIANMHANVIRVFLFEGLEGLKFGSNGHITGIDSVFLDHLDDMINRARSLNLAFELTFNTSNDPSLNGYPVDGGGKVVNWVTDGSAQKDYINNVVRPIVSRYKGYYTVYGYDIMNECNYCVSHGSSTWPQLHSFIYNVASAIHSVDSGAQVTCSTDSLDSFKTGNFFNRVGGCGLNMYDYHNYDDNPNIFSLGSNGPYPQIDKPVVLAEYGADTTPDDDLQNHTTDNYINQASFKGWAGAMAWCYDATGGKYSHVNGLGVNGNTQYWHPSCYTLRWYSVNKFGL